MQEGHEVGVLAIVSGAIDGLAVSASAFSLGFGNQVVKQDLINVDDTDITVRAEGQPVPEDLLLDLSDAELLAQVLVDWDLVDKRGIAIPYTPAVLADLREEWDGLEAALVIAWFDSRRQNAEAAAKIPEGPCATPLAAAA